MDKRKGIIPGFGKRLKQAREKKGLTATQLAERISVSNTTLSNWENSTHMPDPPTVVKLAEQLDETVDYLYCKNNEKALFVDDLSDKQIESLKTIAQEYKTLMGIPIEEE